MNKSNGKLNIKTMALAGMFCALSFAVTLLSKLIPINIAGFLTFDLKDAIVMICGFILGPVPAIVAAIVSSFIEMLTISATGIIGFLMNIISTCAFVLPSAIIYKTNKKFSRVCIGMGLGIVCMAVIMLIWNWLITPLYMGVSREVVVGMLMPVFLPFNLIKGGINAAIAMLLYKPLIGALRKARLVAKTTSEPNDRKNITLPVILVSLFVLATLVLVVLVWTGSI